MENPRAFRLVPILDGFEIYEVIYIKKEKEKKVEELDVVGPTSHDLLSSILTSKINRIKGSGLKH